MAEGKVKIDVDLNEKGATSGIGRLKQSLNGLQSSGSKVGSIFKSALGANIVGAGITKAIGSISGGIKSMVGELNSSSKAWQTFDGNMQMIGKSSSEIAQAKSVLQDYATKTIYSASDMASTYSQLAAVGIESTDKLVTGFGGLAASAENPQQAMKTLSQQATQMASKPTVAWQDFKLMLEQTPAGISAVAKEMGMSTSDLVKAVQDGTVKTEDFFNAIKKVGNNEHFSKMATEFKTVDQAIDGARESLSNKLQPAFDKVSKFGIKAIVGLTDRMEQLDFGKLADNIGKFLDGINIDAILDGIATSIGNVVKVAKELWTGLNDSGAISAVISAFQNVQKAVSNVISALADSGAIKTFATAFGEVVKVIADVVSGIAKFIASLPPSVVKGIAAAILGIVASLKAVKLATKGLDFIKSFKPFNIFKRNSTSAVKGAGKAIGEVFNGVGDGVKKASKGIGEAAKGIGTGIKTALSGVGDIIKSLGTAISTAAQGIGTGLATAFRGLGSAIAMVPPTTWLAIGAAIALVCAGLALLATQSSGVSEILHALGDVIVQIIEAITTAMVTLIPLIVDGITQVVTVITTAIATIVPIITTAITSIVTAIAEGVATIVNSISGLVDSISGLIESIGTALESFGNGIRLALEGVATVIESVGTAIKSAFEGIASVIEATGNAIKSILEGLGSAFEGFGNGVRLALEGVASVVESIGSAIQSALEGVASVVESVGGAIKSVLEGLGEAFRGFGDAVKSVCDGIKEVVESIGDAISKVLDSVAGVFESIGNAAEKAGNGFRLFAEGVKTLVDLSLGDLVATLTATAKGVGAITSHASEMATAGAGMQQMAIGLQMVATAGQMAQGTFTVLPTLISSFTTSLSGLPVILTTTATAVQTFSTNVVTSLAGLMTASGSISSFNTQINTIGTTLSGVSGQMGAFASSLSTLSNAFSIVATGVSALTGAISGISGVLSAVGATAVTTAGQVEQISTAFQNVSNVVSGVVSSINSQVSGMVSTVSGQFSSMAGNIASQMSTAVSTVSSSMGQMASAISTQMNVAKTAVQTACQQFVTTIKQASTQMANEGKRGGQQTGKNIAEGIKSNRGAVNSAMNSLKDTIQSVGSAMRSTAYNVGAQVSNGVASGMYSALGAVTAAANAIVSEVDRALRAKAEIHSPSRLTAKTGRFIGQGVGVGMEKSVGVIDKATSLYQRRLNDMELSFPRVESMLNFGRGGAFAAVGASAGNITNNNNTSNYESLLHIDNVNANSEQDVRRLYEQMKFFIREEGDRL